MKRVYYYTYTTLLKKRLWNRCLPVNFAKFLRTPSGIQYWVLKHFAPWDIFSLGVLKHFDSWSIERF